MKNRTFENVKLDKYFLALGIAILFVACPDVARAQSWTKVASNYPGGADTALLLTDGAVLVHQLCNPNWYKLTPDAFGSYINGTWSAAIPMPPAHAPLYFASAVLADGRIVVIGGEYNYCAPSGTNLASIYNPITNTWAALAPPPLATVGDAQSVVLPNGNFLVVNIVSTQIAQLDPATLSWTPATSTGKADTHLEEGWTLLPNGTVLTVDTQNGTQSEIYNPSTGAWSLAGSTVVSLTDSGGLGIVPEIGPAVLRPDGTVYATGANGHNAVYSLASGTWAASPDFPIVSGIQQLIADGPGALLPDGNVLVATSGFFSSPTHFFEFNGTTLIPEPATPNAANIPSYAGRMLLLPTGQVLFTDGSSDVEIYTPLGTFQAAWRPVIVSAPAVVKPGTTYAISGMQFNGLSQAVAYGDDAQAATNYPLVRITNNATGHVFYNRTHDHSTMAVATGGATVSTNFDAAGNLELGPSTLVVVANGIPSLAVSINVEAGLSLTFTAASATTSNFHNAATVEAALSNGLSPVPGKMVTFTLGSAGGDPTCSGTTNASGTARCAITPNQPVGSYTLAASFAGDTSYGASKATMTFKVILGEATLQFTASSSTVIADGHSATFAATLKQDGLTSNSGQTVTMTLGGTQSCTGTTDATGAATCAILVHQPLGPGTVVAKFLGDASHLPSSVSEPVTTFAFLAQGSMVIGNLNAGLGTAVEFWGAQWTKLNSLTGGPVPDTFKGFAKTAPQNCGGSWTSAPANSSDPPAIMPSYLGVIASSSIIKSGSTISGNIPIIIVLKTNPEYGPSPGRAGTGTVVAVFCH